jgi:hypothetical protein
MLQKKAPQMPPAHTETLRKRLHAAILKPALRY